MEVERMKRQFTVLAVLFLFVFTSASALAGGRPDKDYRDWFGHFAMGASLPTANLDDIVDDAFYLNGGATYWPNNWAMGINLDLGWAEHDVSRAALDAINDAIDADPGNMGSVTGGDVAVWSGSVNAIWGPDMGGSVGFYVIGGVGLDYIDSKLTTQGLVYYPPFCDPWWGWCIPGGVGPGTLIVASDSTWKFAWNAGIGIDFELASGSKLYLEAKYRLADTDRASTGVVPIVLGFRW